MSAVKNRNNAIAGPSNSPPIKRQEEEEDREHSEEGIAKKQKFSRSRTACLQCRSRKSKCGALPPDPCPNCITAKLECQWPAEDGRSSKSRMVRAQMSLLGHTVGDGRLDLGGNILGMMGNSNDMHPTSMTDRGGLSQDDKWLERLLSNNGQMTSPIAPDPFTLANAFPTVSTPFNSANLQSTFDPSLLSIGGPGSRPETLASASVSAASTTDPAQFIWAFSSQLPQIEEPSPAASTNSQPASALNPGPNNIPRSKTSTDEKIVKVTWWRPHGQTAIAPGLKKITLKVRVQDHQAALKATSPHAALHEMSDTPQSLIGVDGMPTPHIMLHLLDVFHIHLGSQFPFLDKETLARQVENKTGSAFLFNCIAGVAARFSNHPAIAKPDTPAHSYGNIFMDRAKVLLGSMLSVPSRDTIIAFVLMCHISFANDCESEMWSLTGLAVRMSYDLGLHLDQPQSSSITAEERRLDKLVFWSVLIMDFALSYGVGRQTTFHLEDITQSLPTEEDIHPKGTSPDSPRSPFPFAAKQMLSYGPLINLLNTNKTTDLAAKEAQIQGARAAAIAEYNQLPQDMQWNVGNLQRHNRSHQGPIFLQLHLWMHCVLASEFLTDGNFLRRNQTNMGGMRSGAATPNSMSVSSLWRNSARTIGDILVLSDIINPYMYYALPFVNQAFYVAGCCYVKEIENHQSSAFPPTSNESSPRAAPMSLSMTPAHPSDEDGNRRNPKQIALSRALLTSVATNNISTLQQGLARQTTYWSGVAWVAGALAQRIEGIELQDVDLDVLTGKLGSYVSLPDVGSVPHSGDRESHDGRNPNNFSTFGNNHHLVSASQGNNGNSNGMGNGFGSGSGSGPGPGSGFGNHDGPVSHWSNSGHDQTANNNGGGFGQFDFNDLEFLSLPFDTGSMEAAQDVTETDVPLQMLQSDWFRLPGNN